MPSPSIIRKASMVADKETHNQTLGIETAQIGDLHWALVLKFGEPNTEDREEEL